MKRGTPPDYAGRPLDVSLQSAFGAASNYAILHGYSDGGALEHVHLSQAGVSLQDLAYAYYPDGRLASVTDKDQDKTSYSYDAAGSLEQRLLPGGVAAQRLLYADPSPDPLHRLLGLDSFNKAVQPSAVKRSLMTTPGTWAPTEPWPSTKALGWTL